MNRPRHAVEFQCQDCGLLVISYATTKLPDPPFCSVCAWLAKFADRIERERVRQQVFRE